MKLLTSRLLFAGALALTPLFACAQKDVKSGVRPQVLSLPTGPGSVEGLGESFEPQLNSGLGRYTLPLKVPPGRAGFSPTLVLQYDAGGGNGPLGLGWNLAFRSVQRQTDKGLPQYGASGAWRSDSFITEAGEELVRVEGDKDSHLQVFRLKNEGAFFRYVYHRDQDFWVCQEPSGTTSYLGARADGSDAHARIRHPDLPATFSWSVAESADPNGNRILYGYQQHLGQVYCARIEYGFSADPAEPNRHTIDFVYADRPDPIVDYRPTFRLVTALRLAGVTMRSANRLVRRYALDYQAEGSLSFLSRVALYGADDVSHLPPAEFTWCQPQSARSSDVVRITGLELAHIVQAGVEAPDDPGAAELLDFNGDGLPDLYESRHDPSNPLLFDVLYRNTGAGRFERVELAPAHSLELAIQSPNSFVQDVNGDGLVDLVAQKGENPEDFVFRLNEGGTWATDDVPFVFPGHETADSVFRNANIRALDLDSDKRTDTLRTWRTVGPSGNGIVCAAFFNNGDGSLRPVDPTTDDIIRGLTTTFAEAQGRLLLADMNGDRLQDLVLLREAGNSGILYWPSMGYGRFDDATDGYSLAGTPDLGGDPLQLERLELQDLDRDGLADLYSVDSSFVRVWLNRNGTSFAPPRDIGFGQSGLFRPADATYRVLDVDGDGFPDLLFYAARQPTPDYLPPGFGFVRLWTGEAANVLKTIANGIGQVTTLTYRSSTVDLLRDQAAGRPWPLFPFPVPVIAQVEVFDGRSSRYLRAMTYHEGYYDGIEKEFRGFASAEQRDSGNDASAPDLIMTYAYDTGMANEALKGKPLRIEARDADDRVFYREANTWQTMTVATGAVGETRTATFAYASSRLRDVLERGNGTPVQLKWDYAYDSWGNLTNQIEWGRMDPGWDDERVTSSLFTAQFPSGQTAWVLDRVVEKVVTTLQGDTVAHKRNFYDGLPFGAVSRGNLTRTEQWIDDTDWTVSVRNDYDAFGNVIAIYDPLFDPGQPGKGHFREIAYDSDWHTFPVREIIHTGATAPATLTMAASYDPRFGVATSSTDFNGLVTSYGFDAFGRLIAMTKPPDTLPTVEYDYVLGRQLPTGTVINWVETRKREQDGSGTIDSRLFYDGLGRTIMTRAEGEFPGQVVVTDTVVFNGRKLPWKNYLPYFETASNLDFVEPTFNTGFTERFYDALGREVRVNQPPGPEGMLFATTAYGPLTRTVQDEEQTRADSIHRGCGMRYVEDGLLDKDGKGRLREVYEIVNLTDTGEPRETPIEWKTSYRYDLLDNLTGYTDAQLNQKFIYYDGLGRKTFMDDPDRSWMWYAYDDVGNLIRTRDAKGQEIAYAYDGVNRLAAEFYTVEAERLGNDLTRAQRWSPPPAALPTRAPDVAYHYDLPLGPLTRFVNWPGAEAGAVATTILDGGGYDPNADLNRDGQIDVSDLVKAAHTTTTHDRVTALNTLGYLSWVSDQSGEEHNSYDERGRVKWTIKRIIDVEPSPAPDADAQTVWGARTVDTTGRPVRNFYTGMTYDSQDRVTRRIYPDGTHVQYRYNSRGLLESIPNVIARYDYNPAGQNLLLELACGVTTTHEYDHRLRLTRIRSVRHRDALTLQDLNYQFDGVSNITAIDDGRSNDDLDAIGAELGITSTEAQKFNATQSFLYDSLYRLTRASNPDVWGTIEHRYDRIGNMIMQNAELHEPDPLLDLGAMDFGGTRGSSGRPGRTPQDEPGPHAVTALSGEPALFDGPAYDPNGNTTQSLDRVLVWDSKDRVVTAAGPTHTARYTYNHAGARRTVHIDSRNASDKRLTTYVDHFSEVRAGRLYKYVLQNRMRIASSAIVQPPALHSVYDLMFFHDHVPSPVLVCDWQSRLCEEIGYHPYGTERIHVCASGTYPVPYRFIGKHWDPETELYCVEARYLSTTLGRFCSTDSAHETSVTALVAVPQLLNPYCYARCNPLSYQDPDGRVIWFTAAAGALVSASLEIGTQYYGAGRVHDWRAVLVEAGAGAVSGAIGRIPWKASSALLRWGVKLSSDVADAGIQLGKELLEGETLRSASENAVKSVVVGKALNATGLPGLGDKDVNWMKKITGNSGNFMNAEQKMLNQTINKLTETTANTLGVMYINLMTTADGALSSAPPSSDISEYLGDLPNK